MRNIFLVHIVIYVVVFVDGQLPEVTRQSRMRCTRRYSPGVCANHVSSVWTFDFQKQNCIERLGCANYFRANRFRSYPSCMRHCQGLVDMYLQMLEVSDVHNVSIIPLRKGVDKASQPSFIQDRQVFPSPQQLDNLGYDMEDYEQGENDTHLIVYKDFLHDDDIFPPDVDQVDGEIRSQYDLLHP